MLSLICSTNIASERPLLLVIEDIHWTEASSLDLLMHLARRTTWDRFSLLLTYRGDEVHPDLEHFLATLDRRAAGKRDSTSDDLTPVRSRTCCKRSSASHPRFPPTSCTRSTH